MENNENRYFLKSQWNNDSMKGTDQAKEIPMPSYEKSFNKDGLISLPDPLKTELKKRDIVEIITVEKAAESLEKAMYLFRSFPSYFGRLRESERLFQARCLKMFLRQGQGILLIHMYMQIRWKALKRVFTAISQARTLLWK